MIYTLITGLSFLFGKISLRYAAPIDILAYRFSAAFITLLLPVLLHWLPWKFSLLKLKKILPLAIFYPLLFFGLQTYGLEYATSAEAGIIFAAIPIFTTILATLILKEKTNLQQKICILLSVFGVIYIFKMNGAYLDLDNLKGIYLLLLSALSFAGYSIMARILTRDFSNVELSYYMITLSFVCYSLFSFLQHLLQGSLPMLLAPLRQPEFIVAILYLGILSTVVTSLMTNYVLSKVEASKMSVFGNLGTVISILAGVTILKEPIYTYHLIGSGLIILGVLGTNFFGDSKI
jgi:drug/metabolite transporter (DMT)-like permease